MSKRRIIEKNAREIRGGILNSALEVENVLTESIGQFYSYSKDKIPHYKLIEDILSDLTFDKKIKNFKKNIDLSFGIFKKHNTIIKDLNEIREIRNQIAHRSISYPWVFDEGDIDENDYNFITEKYVKWKNNCDFQKSGKDDFSFTLDDLKQYEQKCELLVIIIIEGTNELLSPIQD